MLPLVGVAHIPRLSCQVSTHIYLCFSQRTGGEDDQRLPQRCVAHTAAIKTQYVERASVPYRHTIGGRARSKLFGALRLSHPYDGAVLRYTVQATRQLSGHHPHPFSPGPKRGERRRGEKAVPNGTPALSAAGDVTKRPKTSSATTFMEFWAID